MTTVAFLVVIVSLVTLLVVGTEDLGSGHVAFAHKGINAAIANRGVNVQTYRNQDQGCESAGGASGSTNACIATSTPGSTPTSVLLAFNICMVSPSSFSCSNPAGSIGCNSIGCTSISCVGPIHNAVCTTSNGVQLTSCTLNGLSLTCTRTEPGTGISNSGGVTGNDAG
jgi:hypothetical protein